ncbi:hypothetical protein [Novosphingobium lentum]|uniref:hypothetical protein n=1 Tax=Novosphingobium lentum TaxID=145287 RepID=UPI000832CB3A|nr:hypothetical protein [Novosphingobium lentum]
MPAVDLLSSPSRYRASTRSRPVAIVLSLAVIVVIALTMLQLGAFNPLIDRPGGALVAITLTPDSPKHAQEKQMKSAAAPAAAIKVAVVHPPPARPPAIKLPSKNTIPDVIALSHDEFAASDISKLGNHGAGSSSSSAGSGAKAYGPGQGPGGAHLYAAEWYREPTDAELQPYMRNMGAPGDWATIACKTMDHYHVENCQSLDESPPGSGLARALRLAAWQFLVRPPRVDGKPLIGEWVSIRFNFRREAAPSAGE